jgi:hypothetical protein
MVSIKEFYVNLVADGRKWTADKKVGDPGHVGAYSAYKSIEQTYKIDFSATEFFRAIAAAIDGTSVARLDADKTAKPLTSIVHHTEGGTLKGPGIPLVNPEWEEGGKRIALASKGSKLPDVLR